MEAISDVCMSEEEKESLVSNFIICGASPKNPSGGRKLEALTGRCSGAVVCKGLSGHKESQEANHHMAFHLGLCLSVVFGALFS